eukprot:Hpha_TRINITY_DN5862_c0_g1::TRINITY_DN5862_c0_g1_i1::g.45606::m.45606
MMAPTTSLCPLVLLACTITAVVAPTNPNANATIQPARSSSLATELRILADLHREGMLTDAEFTLAKAAVLPRNDQLGVDNATIQVACSNGQDVILTLVTTQKFDDVVWKPIP